MKQLFFFGCVGNQAGHYWEGGRSNSDYIIAQDLNCNPNLIRCIDGTFAPKNMQECIYQYVQVGHVQIVSWWDNSVDKRPQSNSNLVGVGFSSAEEMIDAAYQKFPNEMNRQKERPKLFTNAR